MFGITKRTRKFAAVAGPAALAVGIMSALPYVKQALVSRGVPEAEAEQTALQMLKGDKPLPADIAAVLPQEPWYKKYQLPLIVGALGVGYLVFNKK